VCARPVVLSRRLLNVEATSSSKALVSSSPSGAVLMASLVSEEDTFDQEATPRVDMVGIEDAVLLQLSRC
jgi:hypothetical protein